MKSGLGIIGRAILYTVLLMSASVAIAQAENLRVAVAQTVIEPSLDGNQEKICALIDQAAELSCDIVILPEGGLYWSDIATHEPSKVRLDEAIARIGTRADAADIYVLFGVGYRQTERQAYTNRAVVFDPNGRRVLFYEKNMEVPQSFDVAAVPFNVSICSDRGYLEHSDLPCLVEGTKVIVDISGGHGGDDGRPDLRWIRYRPWAQRTGAFVIVSNPVHDDVDFMGHSPWGGGSAIVRPDGSIQACRTYEKDTLIVEDLDISLATRAEAIRRRNHPSLRQFWDMGARLLSGQPVENVGKTEPFASRARSIKIAAAQVVCSSDVNANVAAITDSIKRAADEDADIVVFPELAVTGCRPRDIASTDQTELDAALKTVCSRANECSIYVIVGMPWHVEGRRMNCAFVIGDDGRICTRYAQIATNRPGLFDCGTNTHAMWFDLRGVRSIVTVGNDANWVELADLAANRGMYLHLHITNETYQSQDDVILARQRNLLMLMYAGYGAVVNAAAADANPPSAGMSMIVCREGGHNKPAPKDVQYYLPYQTSVVTAAGPGQAMITATRKTSARNDMDLNRYWRNRNRARRADSRWLQWIVEGVMLIEGND